MKRFVFIKTLCRALLVLILFGIGKYQLIAQKTVIAIETENIGMILETDKNNRLNTVYFGKILQNKDEYSLASKAYNFFDHNAGLYNSVYTPSGTFSLVEPAIQVTHADGNKSLELKYVSHEQKNIDLNNTLTKVVLKDPVYPFQVTLFYNVWKKENVIEQWAEIKHTEKSEVIMEKYASANIYFTNKDFYLTTFHNEWAKEMQPASTKLYRGMRSIESKAGTRSLMHQSQSFILSFGQPSAENNGMVMLGHLAWSGNFKIEYEVDTQDNLRLIAGINPYASEYHLPPNEVFKTPAFIYSISNNGIGQASRNLHKWARENRVLNGTGKRLTLLNNWEATFFDFNEDKITKLFKDAKKLGVDIFLLDDGWFGNKYPRNSDHAGLGDWQANKKKLPNGIAHLVKEAHKQDIKFGIWIEPEMVNPKSELYEKHIDWVIRQPQRPEIEYRNQFVLDMSNPEVQDFVYNVVDSLFIKNPELAFIKWDCNAMIFNARSEYLHQKNLPQSHLYVDYALGLINVLERIRTKYPKVPMMLCSSGGSRVDYSLLKYFTEFWPSDNTEPIERIYMQWNYSYFYPSIVSDNHVTNWGKQPIKYRVDVASMGKLGFDIIAKELNEQELQFCKQAMENYNSFKHIVWAGDLYRLANPYKNDYASLMYVNPGKSKAIMFNYLLNTRFKLTATQRPVKLQGLHPDKKYKIKEINIFPGAKHGKILDKVVTGNYLMTVGINPHVTLSRTSVVLEIVEVK